MFLIRKENESLGAEIGSVFIVFKDINDAKTAYV